MNPPSDSERARPGAGRLRLPGGYYWRHSSNGMGGTYFFYFIVREEDGELQYELLVILVDDEKRENEGDLVCAAEHLTPDAVNFMLREARGVLCLAMTGHRVVRTTG